MQYKINHSVIDAGDVEKTASRTLKQLYTQYQDNPEGVQVSFRQLCAEWGWAKRSDKYTHLIHSYPAKILPYIPILFLSTEQYANRDESIMDIFAGSATVLLESIIHPVFPRCAYGIEINPLARLIGKVKTTPINSEDIVDKNNRITSAIRNSDKKRYPNTIT